MKKNVIKLLPLLIFLCLWELLVSNDNVAKFYYGSPSEIVKSFWDKTLDGSLWYDTFITAFEAVSGFILGNIFGVSIGLALWFYKPIFEIAKPYIIVLGSAPIFALSPILVVWFGIGISAKIIIAVLSTVFVALLQAFNGAQSVDKNHLDYFKAFNASKWFTFKKLVLPSSLTWVIAGFRLNIGFALLGAFIGEYISATAGLGHMISINSGLFNTSNVLLGVLMMSFIALSLYKLVSLCEKPMKSFVSSI